MKECWLSPYGEVIYTNGKWDHASKAAEIILERYNNGSLEDTMDVWCAVASDWAGDSPSDYLQNEGWIRYSIISNKWIVGADYHIYPTQDQKDKMFELTGFIYTED